MRTGMKMSEKQRNFERLSESQNCCTRPVLKNCKKTAKKKKKKAPWTQNTKK